MQTSTKAGHLICIQVEL